jgi:hypothetical protein
MQYTTYRLINARKEVFNVYVAARVGSSCSGSLVGLLEKGFVCGEGVCIKGLEQPRELNRHADGHDLTLKARCHDNGCEMDPRRVKQ